MRTTRWQGIATASGFGAAGAADRAHRAWLADRPRDLRVGRRLAGRDGAERSPHPLLECGAADVERKIEPLTRRLDETDDLGDHALEFGVAAFELRIRKAVLQVAHQLVRIVAKQNCA